MLEQASPRTDAPDRIRVGTDELTVHVSSDQTGGALLVAEVRLPAGGGPPILHRHESVEVYRVEHGDLTICLENEDGNIERIAAGAGAVVPIPARRAHTVRNESDAEALAYVVFAPGTEMERFVRAAGALAADAPSPADVLALAERHGIEMTGSVPAVG